MKGSAIRSPIDIEPRALLTEEQCRLCRAAIAADYGSQSAFSQAKDLDAGMLSQIINRRRCPSPDYAEALTALITRYLKRIRFTLSRIDL